MTRYLSRVSLVLGIAAAVIYPTVTASIQWGEMQHELRANTEAVKGVAAGLEKLAENTTQNATEISALRDQVAFAAQTNASLANENRELKAAVQQSRTAVQKTGAALKAAVTDNTRATDWHSYRLRQLEETESRK